MSLQWKCVNSILVLKHETPASEEAGISGTQEQSIGPTIEEQESSEVAGVTECDTKNGISVGELNGYTVSHETHNTMPVIQLLPPDAEPVKECIKEEPLKNSLEYSSDAHEYVAGKCEILDNRHSCDNSTEKQIPNKCINCHKYFACRSELMKHMVDSHADVKKLICLLCGKSLKSNSALDIHMFFHIYDKPNRCIKCGKCFHCLTDLKLHMTTHTGEKPYRCTVCDKSFSVSSSLKQHMRVHTGEKPYCCTVCDKSFSVSSSLKQHMRVHTGEKPYSCTECDKSFSSLSGIKQHMMNHTGEKPHSCTVCNKCFRTVSVLKVHMRIHTGEKPYGCTECDKSFCSLSGIKKHMMNHTGEKPHI